MMKMKPSFVIPQVIAAVILLIGLAFLLSGSAFPVYTDPEAPEKLSRKFESLPRAERFARWYEELANYETPHKRLTDFGRGLMALGLGISTGVLFLSWLCERRAKNAGLLIAGFWTALWAIKFPFTMWYYSLRQSRFDYPVWGDSIGIGVFQDFVVWVVGFITSSMLLAGLMIRHRFPSKVALRMPESVWGWFRTVGLWLWVLLLVACILPSVGDGDEGMVFSCTAAMVVILLALSAPEIKGRS